MRIAVVWIAVLTLGLLVRADVLPAAGGFVTSGVSHAWVVGPANGEPKFAVYHLPPRGDDGAMVTARQIAEAPERVAAWDNRVMMAFRPSPSAPGVRTRRVLQISTKPHPLAGGWAYDSGGRLVALPSLPGDGELAGFVGTERGAAALLTGESLRLLVLDSGQWMDGNLPDKWSAGEVRAPLLVALPAGFGLLDLVGPEMGLWRAAPPTEQGDGASAVRLDWTFEPLPFHDAPLPDGPVVCVRGRLVYPAREDANSVAVWGIGPGAAYRMGLVQDVGESFAFVGLDQSDRVALAWAEPAASPPTRTPAGTEATVRYRVVEVSAATGRELYNGPPVGREPVSVSEFRLLALLLVALMVMIVLFVLRPEIGRAPVSLPEGLALAESGRRVAAGLIDLGVAVLVASKIVGVPVGQAFIIFGLIGDGTGQAASLLIATIGVGLAHCTLAEWLFGRSLGKGLAGCRVFHVRLSRGADGTISPAIAKPTLWRALARNVVKWLLPPVALAGLNLPDRRHRGDVIAGTVVVVPAEPPEPD